MARTKQAKRKAASRKSGKKKHKPSEACEEKGTCLPLFDDDVEERGVQAASPVREQSAPPLLRQKRRWVRYSLSLCSFMFPQTGQWHDIATERGLRVLKMSKKGSLCTDRTSEVCADLRSCRM